LVPKHADAVVRGIGVVMVSASILLGGLVFFKKILEFVVVSCFALGTIILFMWSPVLQAAKENKPLGPSVDSAPWNRFNSLDRFIPPDISV
jgi:hypothetical protein